MTRRICIVLVALGAGSAVAQEARRPGPADPKAKAPPVEYRSAFEGYRPYSDQKVTPWRESNDAVKPKPGAKPPAGGAHGGHR